MDLEAFMITQQPSFWSWIASVNGYIDFQRGQMFVSLTKMLALFLVIILAMEIGIAVYAYFKIDLFAEETLKELT